MSSCPPPVKNSAYAPDLRVVKVLQMSGIPCVVRRRPKRNQTIRLRVVRWRPLSVCVVEWYIGASTGNHPARYYWSYRRTHDGKGAQRVTSCSADNSDRWPRPTQRRQSPFVIRCLRSALRGRGPFRSDVGLSTPNFWSIHATPFNQSISRLCYKGCPLNGAPATFRRSLSAVVMRVLVQVFVHCKLDYCNSLLTGVYVTSILNASSNFIIIIIIFIIMEFLVRLLHQEHALRCNRSQECSHSIGM